MTRMQTRAAFLRNAAQLDMFAALDAPLADRDQVDIRDVLARPVAPPPSPRLYALDNRSADDAGLAYYYEQAAALAPADLTHWHAIIADFLTRKRHTYGHESKAQQQAAAARRLDRDDVQMAYRTAFPRPFDDLADEAWQVVSEYDRLCRDPRDFDARKHELRCALDALMREANAGTSFGVRVNPGPKRLMKALRVRARAEKRLPMWGVKGRFRFQWRGLTMIGTTGTGFSIQLDTDRHAPGTPCHSSTGYRSFIALDEPRNVGGTPQDYAAATLDAYTDSPRRNDGGGGLGGNLVPWWPWCVETLRSCRRDYDYGPEWWAEHGAKVEARAAEAEAKVRAMGLDPDVVAPWPAKKQQGALL